ncbi:transglycosylase SLT domain-containing protein [Gordonia sihwensis]|uniref:transglycosylase SLT domain-containing protein n=1 Tax=Gordonia sihwensis TaxID=173559 RepID=UPI003D97E491
MGELAIDPAKVVSAVRGAIDDAVRPRTADLPDPRFNGAVEDNGKKSKKNNDRAKTVGTEVTKAVRDQGDANRRGVTRLTGGPTDTLTKPSGTTTAGDTPTKLSAEQLASRQQFQQQLQQLMTPQAQQQGTSAFNQMTPAMQQGLGTGASAVGQYPPGSVAISRTQLAALLAAVGDAESASDGGNGQPGSGSKVGTLGEVSNKGAISVEEVALQKSDSGPMSKEEIDQVIVAACEANGITDPQAQARWLDTMRNVVQHESGNNPNAGNGWDSNAVGQTMPDGLPAKSSRGLAQCIPSTFAAYHVQGTSTNIYDPTASVAASINYISHRYGDGVKDGTTLGEFNAARSGSYVGY